MIKLFLFAFLGLISLPVCSQIEGTLLSNWTDTTLVGSTSYNNSYNEVWGIAKDGREYAIIGTTFGTHFIDVTNPEQLEELFVVKGATSGKEIVHRDYHDHNGFLYAVADEGFNSTLQIMDLSYLPDSISMIYDSRDLIYRTHNIFIDSSSSIMYACVSNGATVNYSPLRLFDISDPYEPKVISQHRIFGNLTLSEVHDAYVKNDTAYLNCGSRGLLIVDFNDPVEPELITILGTFDYPQSGYNHSGWLSDDGKTYFMADETWGMDMKVVDVSDKLELVVIDTIDAGSTHPLTIPHNQIAHGNYLYTAYYYDGLQVYDIRDVNDIKRVMYYPTSNLETRRTYEGAWGIYPFLPSGNILVSDMQEGLFVIKAVEENSSTTDKSFQSKQDIQLFPQPAYQQFELKGLDLKDKKIALLDQNGRIIRTLDQSGSYTILLAPGQYYIHIQGAKTYLTKSLMIAH